MLKKYIYIKDNANKHKIDLGEHVTVKRCPVESPNTSKARPPKRQAISLSRPEAEEEMDAPNIIPVVQTRSTTIPTHSAKTRLDFSSTSTAVPLNEALFVESTNTVASETESVSPVKPGFHYDVSVSIRKRNL